MESVDLSQLTILSHKGNHMILEKLYFIILNFIELNTYLTSILFFKYRSLKLLAL